MNRSRLATVVVVAAIGVGLIFLSEPASESGQRKSATSDSQPGRKSRAPGRAGGESPQDVLYAMFDAARAGKTRDYLKRFAGGLRERLERDLGELGGEGFADYLRKTQRDVKGIAISPAGDSEAAEAGRNARRFEVTFVFSDRNEMQVFTLLRDGSTWRVSDIGESEYQRPLVPYGAPAVRAPAGAEAEADGHDPESEDRL